MNKFDYLEYTVNTLIKCNFRYSLRDLDDDTILVSVIVPAVNNPNLTVGIELNNIGMTAFRCTAAKCCDVGKRQALFDLLNRFMYDFRFVRFMIEDSGDIAADYHLMCFGEDEELIGRQILMSMLTLGDICDKVYPHLMKTIWGGCNCDANAELEYSGGVQFGRHDCADGDVMIDEELIKALLAASQHDEYADNEDFEFDDDADEFECEV